MFAAGSPPFGTMGACYYYNPRHGQPISVPKIWKCRHRRSVAPEEDFKLLLHRCRISALPSLCQEITNALVVIARIQGYGTSSSGTWMCFHPLSLGVGAAGCLKLVEGKRPDEGQTTAVVSYGISGISSEGFPRDCLSDQTTTKDLPNKDGGAWFLGYRAGPACPFLLHEEREKPNKSELYLDLHVLAKCLLTGPNFKNTETFRYYRKLSPEAASYAPGKQSHNFSMSSVARFPAYNQSVGNYLEQMFGGDFVRPVLVLGKLGL
ncbi:hypothetical protein PANDA_006209 [Ailuropoda melanoleuca]|uniref:Uncharacterized protein n=1 Tax=Ailuropoda melanoleuca TaxID=9646 RepID=D2H7R0_AILME|nr:hypothetical protein PANDA_006209 [Ailuropoda melanoleuca]